MSVAEKPTTAVANDKPKPLTIRQHLEGDEFKASISKVLPRHVTPDRMVRVAITALTRNPKLKECDPGSFFLAMMNLSQWGLEPDGRRAHLIPFENRSKGIVECQLIIDYKGLAELVLRSGVVSFIHADLVCVNDDFEYDRGELKRHKIDYKKPRGEVYAVYCLVRMKDGTEKCDVLSTDEINEIRDKSQGYIRAERKGKDSPWHKHWGEMAKKTAFRRTSKWVPLSAEVRDAAEIDDDVIDGEVLSSSVRQVNRLEDLTDRLTGAGDSNDGDEPLADQPDIATMQLASDKSIELYQAEIASQADVAGVKKLRDYELTRVNDQAWPQELRDSATDRVAKLADERIAVIQAGRGEGSNKQKQQPLPGSGGDAAA